MARLEDLRMLGLLTEAECGNEHAPWIRAPQQTRDQARPPSANRNASLQVSAPSPQISLASGGQQRDECDDRGRGRRPKENQTKMTAFTISDDNHITGFARAEEVAQAGDTVALVFDSQAALARISAEWPLSRLVDLYNCIAGHGKIQKFANHSQAVSRIWEAIQPLGGNAAGGAPQAVPIGKVSKPRKRRQKSQSGKSQKTTKGRGQVRESGGKKAAVIAMMKRAKGVTLSEITAATGWQKHTVRGFVSLLASKGGEKVESSKNSTGERTYRIAK